MLSHSFQRLAVHCLFAGAAFVASATSRTDAAAPALPHPNILLILTGDQGYGDLGMLQLELKRL